MPGREPEALKLKRKHVIELHTMLRDGHTPHRAAQRARILLACGQHEQPQAVAAKVGQASMTVWRVCDRYRQGGLPSALYDAPRSGRPRPFFPAANAARLSAWPVALPKVWAGN